MIDELDVLIPPTQFQGAVVERILQLQALLIGEHLMGSGLSDVDECLALQMQWTHQFGSAHRVPPAGSMRVRREDGVASLGTSASTSRLAERALRASQSSAMVMSSLTASSVSLVEMTGRDEASVVEATGSRKTMCSRYETKAKPTPCKGALTEINGKRRPNRGWVGSLTSISVLSFSSGLLNRVVSCGIVRQFGSFDPHVHPGRKDPRQPLPPTHRRVAHSRISGRLEIPYDA